MVRPPLALTGEANSNALRFKAVTVMHRTTLGGLARAVGLLLGHLYFIMFY